MVAVAWHRSLSPSSIQPNSRRAGTSLLQNIICCSALRAKMPSGSTMKILHAIAAMTVLVNGAFAFLPPAQRTTSLTKTFMSYGDESNSWWGKAGAFKDDQVQTYATPRRTKHGALYDGDSIIDLSRWDDGTYVYDEPAYRSERSSRIDDGPSYEQMYDSYTPVDRTISDQIYNRYNEQYAYHDEPRNSRAYDDYASRSDYYESNYRNNEEPYYASGSRYEEYSRNMDYENYSRPYASQTYRSSDESSSWWGAGNAYNNNQVQTYTQRSAQHDPMREMYREHHNQHQPQYFH
jgi:hypothetical protein